MIRIPSFRSCLAPLAIALMTTGLVACGSGSSSDVTAAAPSGTVPTVPAAGSSSSASAAAATNANGVLTAFGSVFVNGREYAVDGSTNVLDGDADDAAASASALKVGMMVNLAAGSSGTASQLRFTSAVRGEIDAINTSTSTLTVLGQTVVVSSGTSFAGSKTVGTTSTPVTSIANLSVGDYVIVYGYLDCTSSTTTSSCTGGTTRVLASLVFEPAAAGVYRTTGYAQSVNATTKTFKVGGLTVAYTTTGTTPTSCTPTPCAVANGDYVEVRSSSAPVSAAGAITLTASKIVTTTNTPVLVSGQTTSIEGSVANLNAASGSFTIRGLSIDASALAATVATLTNGSIVTVTGTVNANGSLKATAITVEQQATLALVAPLTAESASASTLTMLGQAVTVNSTTKFADLARNVQPFNLSNFSSVLAVGDQLEVSAYRSATGLVATRVVRLPTPGAPYVSVQGVVTADSVASNTLTVGGVLVTLNSATTLFYPGAGNSPTVGGYLGAITVGTTVASVRGAVGATASSMTATSASLFDASCNWAAGGF